MNNLCGIIYILFASLVLFVQNTSFILIQRRKKYNNIVECVFETYRCNTRYSMRPIKVFTSENHNSCMIDAVNLTSYLCGKIQNILCKTVKLKQCMEKVSKSARIYVRAYEGLLFIITFVWDLKHHMRISFVSDSL